MYHAILDLVLVLVDVAEVFEVWDHFLILGIIIQENLSSMFGYFRHAACKSLHFGQDGASPSDNFEEGLPTYILL